VARQKQDADACRATLKARQFDWLIVDHYALDIHWEEALRPYYSRLMVIDDLADRRHVCDLLLDQNLGRKPSDYERLIPESCMVLAGPQYALLRPEFAALREYSLMRREKPNLRNILITMGGVDQPNATCRVLEALNQCTLPSDCKIGVVMGDKAPWLEQVKASAAHLRWPAEVLVNISDMAQRMADCDLVIGAAGSTAWERCCLGVPTLMVVLADNQRFGAEALQGALAAKLLGNVSDIGQLPIIFTSIVTDAELQSMGRMAARITDGLGATRVVDSLAGLPR
jgi:UDP-2,4-diacetamido-2,4,6-trideoxy-beta-L-altropyranose hydrolase